VNNAGFGTGGPVIEMELETVRQVFETNFFGLLGRQNVQVACCACVRLSVRALGVSSPVMGVAL
jgi:NAD(P)-dependent dehydrogenase (short-subunit alcohol dehydrogenase family)